MSDNLPEYLTQESIPVGRFFSDEALHLVSHYENMTSDDERSRAARYVAANSTGVEDCAELLDMLGLSADIGISTRTKAH